MTGLGLLALMSAPSLAQDAGRMDVTAYPKLAKKPGMQINILPYELTTGVYTFPSGFRVMFQSDNTLPVVASTMIIDHGSSDDPQGMEGMAHLYEHLWFRTEQGDLPKTWDLLNHELGCSINAYTQYDHTGYMTVCPADHLDKLVALEGLRLSDPMEGVPEDTIPTEIEVVRNEIRMRSSTMRPLKGSTSTPTLRGTRTTGLSPGTTHPSGTSPTQTLWNGLRVTTHPTKPP